MRQEAGGRRQEAGGGRQEAKGCVGLLMASYILSYIVTRVDTKAICDIIGSFLGGKKTNKSVSMLMTNLFVWL